jgi:hypothetical protein
MEAINIIAVICMINIWMDEYLYKSTRRTWDYNKNGEYMWMLMKMAMVMITTMMMLLPPRILVDAGSMPSTSSTSGSLPEARFREFLVSLCVGSLFRLRRVGVFDEAKPPTPDTGGDTGRLCPYACPLKSLLLSLMTTFLPGK